MVILTFPGIFCDEWRIEEGHSIVELTGSVRISTHKISKCIQNHYKASHFCFSSRHRDGNADVRLHQNFALRTEIYEKIQMGERTAQDENRNGG